MLLSKPNRFYEIQSKEVDVVIDLEEVLQYIQENTLTITLKKKQEI